MRMNTCIIHLCSFDGTQTSASGFFQGVLFAPYKSQIDKRNLWQIAAQRKLWSVFLRQPFRSYL